MATIRSRNGSWQVRVVRKGHPPVSKTFTSKTDAVKWARSVESQIDLGSYKNLNLADRTLFKDVIKRYIEEVLSDGHREDIYRLKALSRHWIGKLSMLALLPPQLHISLRF